MMLAPEAEEALTGVPPDWWKRQPHEPLWQFSQRIDGQLRYGFAEADRAKADREAGA
jgi:hypothetical protein